ncbi:hypothetical protein LOTGIDRAFT_163638 [Lottia gigantea]|uniref:Uncharacterized protein n=1 Tax=Lottia gigantea TaxID=225164 RepID=V4A324_LOTGI|nr:hypothetical protein LOTGIDRAFT_163638 [Lottia gigantea]ESO91107.1 hypothetical protein LOTGIDRAFT_163638 [Lottia gigantea]
MRLVLILLSAAFLALSSAATTQRPVDEKDILSSIKQPLPEVINDKDFEKEVDEALKEEFGSDVEVPVDINDEDIEKIVDEAFKDIEEDETDEEEQQEEVDENEVDDESETDDDEE